MKYDLGPQWREICWEATRISFVNLPLEKIRKMNPVDVSFERDESVLACRDNSDENHLIITSTYPGGSVCADLRRNYDPEIQDFRTTKMMFFSSLGHLEELVLDDIDLSHTRDFSEYFRLCFSLKEIDLSHCDLTNLKLAEEMFLSCHKLEKVVFPTLMPNDMSDTEVISMFSGCWRLDPENIIGLPETVNKARAFFGYPLLDVQPDDWETELTHIHVNEAYLLSGAATLQAWGLIEKRKYTRDEKTKLQFLFETPVKKAANDITDSLGGTYTKADLIDYLEEIRDKMNEYPWQSMLETAKAGVPIKDILI